MGTVRAFTACAANTPSADFCHRVRNDLSLLSLEFETGSRSPEVSSTAFDAQPLDLHSVPLMDVGFATSGQLARTLPASYPVLVHRLASLLRASFRPHLTVRPLRFAITSRPSRCEEDLHLLAVDHARHTTERGEAIRGLPPSVILSRELWIVCFLWIRWLPPRCGNVQSDLPENWNSISSVAGHLQCVLEATSHAHRIP